MKKIHLAVICALALAVVSACNPNRGSRDTGTSRSTTDETIMSQPGSTPTPTDTGSSS